MSVNLKSKIRTIPDFPHKGIMFRDITTLLLSPEGFEETINQLTQRYSNSSIDLIAGIEARGFIFGAALAYNLKKGFVPIRKKGKLPGETLSEEYKLEYGVDTIEIHTESIKKGQKILIVDDLLATGGTILGAIKLIEKSGGVVEESCFVVNLPELKGAQKLTQLGHKWHTLVEFEGE